MRAQTFLAQMSMESLQTMDEQINSWLDRTGVQVRSIKQVFAYAHSHHHDGQEPVMVVTVWYDARGPRPGPGDKE